MFADFQQSFSTNFCSRLAITLYFAKSSPAGYGTWAGSWFGNDEDSEAPLSASLLNLITELMHTAREKNIH